MLCPIFPLCIRQTTVTDIMKTIQMQTFSPGNEELFTNLVAVRVPLQRIRDEPEYIDSSFEFLDLEFHSYQFKWFVVKFTVPGPIDILTYQAPVQDTVLPESWVTSNRRTARGSDVV